MPTIFVLRMNYRPGQGNHLPSILKYSLEKGTIIPLTEFPKENAPKRSPTVPQKQGTPRLARFKFCVQSELRAARHLRREEQGMVQP